jgi:hypothetical protein
VVSDVIVEVSHGTGTARAADAKIAPKARRKTAVGKRILIGPGGREPAVSRLPGEGVMWTNRRLSFDSAGVNAGGTDHLGERETDLLHGRPPVIFDETTFFT